MVHPISTGSSTKKESEKTRRTKIKKKKMRKKNKFPARVLNPGYRIPTKRSRAIPSDPSDMAVLSYAVSQIAVLLER